jgi:hypothetical protein
MVGTVSRDALIGESQPGLEGRCPGYRRFGSIPDIRSKQPLRAMHTIGLAIALAGDGSRRNRGAIGTC